MGVQTVLPAVDLNHDPLFEAGEVHDEAADRNLSAEVQARRSEQAQLPPELLSCGVAERLSARVRSTEMTEAGRPWARVLCGVRSGGG